VIDYKFKFGASPAEDKAFIAQRCTAAATTHTSCRETVDITGKTQLPPEVGASFLVI
jgi:hypothetical protein